MSQGSTLRVTPVELAGVAAQVRTLSQEMLMGSARLRTVVARVDPPDPAADQVLLAGARQMHAALGEVSELLGFLLARLGAALDGQAAALAAAAHGYAYVERQVGAAADPGGRRRE